MVVNDGLASRSRHSRGHHRFSRRSCQNHAASNTQSIGCRCPFCRRGSWHGRPGAAEQEWPGRWRLGNDCAVDSESLERPGFTRSGRASLERPPLRAQVEGTLIQELVSDKEVRDQIVKELSDRITSEKNQQIEKQLDLLIDAQFPNGVSLADLLKYIKQETTKARPPGIPIYVNPLGLQDAEKSMDFAVTLSHQQKPVREILTQGLMGSGLSFTVRDGFLMIDSRTGILEIRVEEIDRKLDRVLKSLERLEKGEIRPSGDLWPLCFPFRLAFPCDPGKILRAANSRRPVRSLVRACISGSLVPSFFTSDGARSRGIDFFDRHDGRDGRRPRNTSFCLPPKTRSANSKDGGQPNHEATVGSEHVEPGTGRLCSIERGTVEGGVVSAQSGGGHAGPLDL